MPPDFELWLDNHFGSIVAKWLKDDFDWLIKSPWALKIHGMDDTEIFLKAKAAGNNVILITKDFDFGDIMARYGPPPKIINVRIGNSSNEEMYVFLAQNLPKAIRLLNSFDTKIINLD